MKKAIEKMNGYNISYAVSVWNGQWCLLAREKTSEMEVVVDIPDDIIPASTRRQIEKTIDREGAINISGIYSAPHITPKIHQYAEAMLEKEIEKLQKEKEKKAEALYQKRWDFLEGVMWKEVAEEAWKQFGETFQGRGRVQDEDFPFQYWEKRIQRMPSMPEAIQELSRHVYRLYYGAIDPRKDDPSERERISALQQLFIEHPEMGYIMDDDNRYRIVFSPIAKQYCMWGQAMERKKTGAIFWPTEEHR